MDKKNTFSIEVKEVELNNIEDIYNTTIESFVKF